MRERQCAMGTSLNDGFWSMTVGEREASLKVFEDALRDGGGNPRVILDRFRTEPEYLMSVSNFMLTGCREVVREVVTSIPFTEAEKSAIVMLGSEKVLTQAQAKGEAELPICYSEDTLRACAKENTKHGRDWRLVYLRGNSLREERERVGENRKQQPRFNKDHTWWLGASGNNWATEKFEPGYYLIDFNGRFGRTSWQNQKEAIAGLGSEFERAHEAMVTEGALRIFEATGERLLPNWWHWGRSLDSCGGRVSVGLFAPKDWHVHYYFRPVWDDDAFLRVCLLRKFQN